MHWLEIYLVDSFIHLFSNWGLMYNLRNTILKMRHYPGWDFCSRSSDFIFWENQWPHYKMLAAFSCYIRVTNVKMILRS